jgi:hypothetical protein
MTRFLVDWSELKTAKTGKAYKALTIKDEAGKPTNVNIFSDWPDFANVGPGSHIEGELEQNGKYWNLRSNAIKEKRPNMDRVMEKKSASIAEAQQRKEQSISQAQDRSAWMWAKNNAVILIANNKDLKDREDLIPLVGEMATEIYNLEPNKPF